jgi:hypothetical protein
MIPRTRQIRRWLLQQPKPHSLRVTSGEDIQVLEFGTQKFVQVAASIEALDPEKIEALDANGKLLRAIKAEQFETPVEEEEDDGSSGAAASKSQGKQLEREMVMLSKFGELLAAAYQHSTNVAFTKMVELFEAVAKRGESLEKSLAATERLLRRAYEEGAGNKEEGEPSLLETMMSTFAAGQRDGSIEKAVATAAGKKTTNGKAQI